MLHTQLASVQAVLATKKQQSARLHDVLDEATEQLVRETWASMRDWKDTLVQSRS